VNVGLVIRKFQERGGGTERYLHGLARHLLSRGAGLHVFAASCDSPLPGATFHPVRLPPGPPLLKTAAFARRVPAALAACPGLDVVCGVERLCGLHVHLATGGSHREYLQARRKAAGPLWRLHSRLRPLNLLVLSLERRMYQDPSLRRVRVMSSRGAAELARLYGLAPERLAVIPHGVDLGRFDLGRRQACRSELRRRHNLAGEEFVALMVGSGFERKGLAHLLRALGLLRAKGARLPRLLVIGRGTEARHRRLAARLGLAEQVVFLGLSERVVDYLLAADLFILPSLYETFGLAILEAMAAGLPVIVSAACGASELIRDGDSGFVLAEPADREAFAARIQALSDPGLRRQFGARARETAAGLSLERDYRATCALLEEAARQRP
jgi:UDP-glucose:(heptosyl)LPS alpha-1,3-glucosyltransferase